MAKTLRPRKVIRTGRAPARSRSSVTVRLELVTVLVSLRYPGGRERPPVRPAELLANPLPEDCLVRPTPAQIVSWRDSRRVAVVMVLRERGPTSVPKGLAERTGLALALLT